MRPVDLGELLPSIRASIVLSRQDLDLDVEPDVVTENNPEHLERLFRDIIEERAPIRERPRRPAGRQRDDDCAG